jgi:hypothetical protein
MGSSASNRGDLAPLQREVLRAFHRVEQGFFLTGGAALAGYHLHHRTTSGLDLFTLDPAAFERGQHALAEVAVALGAEIETRQDAPGFHRAILSRGDDAVVVDLVLDRSVQRVAEKLEIDGVRVEVWGAGSHAAELTAAPAPRPCTNVQRLRASTMTRAGTPGPSGIRGCLLAFAGTRA